MLEKMELKIEEHSLNIDAQDKMHSNIYKRVTDMYASQEEKNEEISKTLAKLAEEAANYRTEVRAALKKKDQEVSEISQYQVDEAAKLKDSLESLDSMKSKVFDMEIRCQYLEQTTAQEQKQRDRFQEIEKMFIQVDYALEDIKSSMATTDTFIDHYMPHKINKMTIKMLRQLY